MKKALLVLTAVLPLAGCGEDNGRCLAQHDEKFEAVVQIGAIPAGGMAIPIFGTMPSYRTVCDKWEFPNGLRERH